MEDVCRNLRTPYFRISINKTSAPAYGGTPNPVCQLSIPARFIKEHGDKIHEHITLQAEASGRVWPVKLWPSAYHGRVVMTTGWKAFASSNELEQGDYAIFSLMAMSQFVVYIFDVTGTLKEPRCSPTSYKPCNNCQDCKACPELWKSEKLRKKQSNEATSGHQVLLDKRKFTVSRLSDRTEQPASGRLSKIGPVEGGRDERAISSGSKDQSLQQLPKMSFQRSSTATTLPGFLKTLTITCMQGPLGHGSGARLEIPSDFLRLHEHQLRKVVKLQGPYQEVAVQYRKFASTLRAYFRGTEWRQFLDRNLLKEGDELLFTLVATSCFAVKRLWE